VSIPIVLLVGPMQAQFMQRILENASEMQPEMRQWLDNFAAAGAFSVVHLIISFFFMLVVGAIFGALGGMLGVLFFKKNLPPAPPPVPPSGFPPPFNPPPTP
jgi:hypothetical protein